MNSRRAGEREAIGDSSATTSLLVQTAIAPALGRHLIAGIPEAIAEFDALVRDVVLAEDIDHARLWSPDGVVLYSDESSLIGERYEFGVHARRALVSGSVVAAIDDLSDDENASQRPDGSLLEVYAPVSGPDGRTYLFETYQSFERVDVNASQLWWTFAPTTFGALVMLELIHIRHRIRLGRELRRSRDDRDRMLRRAIEAGDAERRRIARDLHDGAVQDLVGVSLMLASVTERGTQWHDPVARGRVQDALSHTRSTIRTLRSRFVEDGPANPTEAGLERALDDLVAGLRARGVETSVDVDVGGPFGERTCALIYRIAVEAVRNVERHARASALRVTVDELDDHTLAVAVSDDGVGFDGGLGDSMPDDCVGLGMLHELVRGSGGAFRVVSEPAGGTTVRAEVPR